MEKHNQNFENWHRLSPEEGKEYDNETDESVDIGPDEDADNTPIDNDHPSESGKFDGSIDIYKKASQS